jgi:threonine dehydratase
MNAIRAMGQSHNGGFRDAPDRIEALPVMTATAHPAAAPSQPTASPLLTLADIRAAQARIGNAVLHTPTTESRTLSEMVGARVFLKFENLQFTAAYKERGALNTLLLMEPEARARGVIAASAGNHAQGLAYHGARLGVPVTIVMPQTTPQVKVYQTASHGAEIVLFGEKYDDAYAHARELEAQRGLTFVHPFDDPRIAAGQGTVALEMLEDQPDIDTLIIPIGGGGLFSGMGTAARALKPDIRLVGVQAELYPSMYARLNHVDMPCEGDTLAEGIAVKHPGDFTSSVVAKLADDIVLVAERHLERAVSLLLQIEKTVVEGAGAAGFAAMLAHGDRFRGRNVGLVLCGGNIDTRLLANVLLRDLARSGRLARLRIRLQDRPGALFNVMRVFNEHQVNIVEIYHQRIFTTLPAKGLITDIECETRDRDHLDTLVAALRTAGYQVTMVELA